MDSARISTPLGVAEIRGDAEGIVSISISDGKGETDAAVPPHLRAACEQIRDYFDGTRREFNFPMRPEGTDFQQRVWDELLKIPFGRTVSYLELSRRLGDPKAIRAVAAANGRNPIWLAIPCHRVIGSDGSLVGYAGGIHRKKWLLNHESPAPQASLFGSNSD